MKPTCWRHAPSRASNNKLALGGNPAPAQSVDKPTFAQRSTFFCRACPAVPPRQTAIQTPVSRKDSRSGPAQIHLASIFTSNTLSTMCCQTTAPEWSGFQQSGYDLRVAQ
jgi:hypothetical protein